MLLHTRHLHLLAGITKYKHGKLPMPRCVDGDRSLLPLTICPTPQALKEVLKILSDPTVRVGGELGSI